MADRGGFASTMGDGRGIDDASRSGAAQRARSGGRGDLARALMDSRADTLATFSAYQRALPDLCVPQRDEFNPPLWELGHIGWFQSYWIERNPELSSGERADPTAVRRPPHRPGADALYNSSLVPHAQRWHLLLPDAAATRDDLARQLDSTLALLDAVDADDAALYFFRLALLHEDMHHEAALYMARGLGIDGEDPRWSSRPLPPPTATLAVGTCDWRLGSAAGEGFAFDNERPAVTVAVKAFCIDRQAVRWAEFLPFVEAGGYRDPRWWSDAGARWLAQQGQALPRYLRIQRARWEVWRHGVWLELDLTEAATHLTLHEVQAWCQWAGRRLPTEAEWECAACQFPDAFRWGDAWEWTASPFRPFAGFEPHPYRDYSAPWFDGRPVLRGASPLTQPRMRHPRYRNFFAAGRNDVPAGFRTCAT
jgi:gamma-glutamyl hercynylcysteine S-oxide synthase